MFRSTAVLKEGFKNDQYRQRLRDIYVDEAVLEYQKERYIKALENFEQIYGEKEVELYSAPGRSEVGGNHTDHQHGTVLATSLNLDAIAVVAKTENQIITMKSEGYRALEVDLSDLEPQKSEEGGSKGLIRGVAAGLKQHETPSYLPGTGCSHRLQNPHGHASPPVWPDLQNRY